MLFNPLCVLIFMQAICSVYDASFVSGNDFITKQSKLSEAYVVFRLAIDDQIDLHVHQANMSSCHKCVCLFV